MKTIILSLAALTLSLSLSAQQTSSTAGLDMLGNFIVGIFYLVIFILCVILFFKLWSMTNRVKSIDEKLSHLIHLKQQELDNQQSRK